MKLLSTASTGLLLILALSAWNSMAFAQTAPSDREIENYSGLHRAAHDGDMAAIAKLVSEGANLNARDGLGRTPLHVAVFASHDDSVYSLAKMGADLNALENSAYDVVTVAAVANDIKMVDLVLSLGASAKNITSPYEGTALIAAAHLGHFQVVKSLITSGAPLDHVNNLGWTALIEAVILGDGGVAHIETVRALVKAGADKAIADRQGVTPLQHAQSRDYTEIVELLRDEE